MDTPAFSLHSKHIWAHSCRGRVPFGPPACLPGLGALRQSCPTPAMALGWPLPRPAQCTTLLHHPGWVLGGDHLHQPSQAMNRWYGTAWSPTLPGPTPQHQRGGQAGCPPPQWSACHEAGLIFRPAVVHAFPATPGEVEKVQGAFLYPTLKFGCCTPQDDLSFQPPQNRYPQCQKTPTTRLDL
jgi:hypothetical protein